MKTEKQTDRCEVQTETCSTEEEATTCSSEAGNKFTTVKTAYARAAVFLLAVNFCLTGYVVYNMNETTQEQIDGISGVTTEETSTPQTAGAQTQPTQPTQPSASEPTTSAPVTTEQE